MTAQFKKRPPPGEKAIASKKESEKEIDRQMENTFPASDPPSFSGGEHFVGAPKGRETPEEDALKGARKLPRKS